MRTNLCLPIYREHMPRFNGVQTPFIQDNNCIFSYFIDSVINGDDAPGYAEIWRVWKVIINGRSDSRNQAIPSQNFTY